MRQILWIYSNVGQSIKMGREEGKVAHVEMCVQHNITCK